MGDRLLHVGRPSIGSAPNRVEVVGAGDTKLPEHDDASARRPPRVLIISGGWDLKDGDEQLGRDLHAQGLQVEMTFLTQWEDGTQAEKLARLEQDLAEKFDRGSFDHVIFHGHGMYGDSDMHCIATQDGRFVVSTQTLMQRVASIASAISGKETTQRDARKMPIFHVACCGIGLTRKQVAGLKVNMLFYAGKNECEKRDTFDTLSAVFRDVSNAYRKNSPEPGAKDLWLRALGTSGENLTCIDDDGIHVHGPLKTDELPDGRATLPDDKKDQRDLNAKLMHGSVRSVKAILEKYGMGLLHKTSFRGRPVMHSAIAASRDAMEKAAYLIGLGLDINQADEKGSTALHHAVVNLPVTAVQNFLKFSPDLGARNHAGYSALHLAAMTKSLEKVDVIVREMKAKGIDIDLKDGAGRTALMVAAYLSTPEIIRLLLRDGANPDLPGGLDGRSARYLAQIMGKTSHQEAFRAHDASTFTQ